MIYIAVPLFVRQIAHPTVLELAGSFPLYAVYPDSTLTNVRLLQVATITQCYQELHSELLCTQHSVTIAKACFVYYIN